MKGMDEVDFVMSVDLSDTTSARTLSGSMLMAL
jgi:hypothetical protein